MLNATASSGDSHAVEVVTFTPRATSLQVSSITVDTSSP
jgi:hypothetical protein